MKSIAQLESEAGTFSIETAMSEGWTLVSKHMLYYILGGIITVVISIAVGIIPFAGSLANALILSPCLMAGAVYVTWRISRGIAWSDFGDMFKAFTYWAPLMVSTLIQGLISILIAVLLLMNYIPEMMELYRLSEGTGTLTNKEEIKELILGILNMKTAILISLTVILLGVMALIWCFKTHFIVIYKMQGWPAMELSRKVVMQNFIPLLGLFILMGLIIIISALPCGIGLLFTMPWMIGTTYSAFAQITDAHIGNEETVTY